MIIEVNNSQGLIIEVNKRQGLMIIEVNNR